MIGMTVAEFATEDTVRTHTEWTAAKDLSVGDVITTTVELWAVRVGERYLVENYHNGWYTLIKQRSTGLNCWDDVPDSTRKLRANKTSLRRITHADAFHHLNNRSW